MLRRERETYLQDQPLLQIKEAEVAAVMVPLRSGARAIEDDDFPFEELSEVAELESRPLRGQNANGLALAYIYVKEQRAGGFNGLTEDEARRIAAKIARLPDLLSRKLE